jgi:hypothetical protein
VSSAPPAKQLPLNDAGRGDQHEQENRFHEATFMILTIAAPLGA